MSKELPKVAWQMRDWFDAISSSKAAFYQWPPERRPASILVGRNRLIIEDPRDWLARMQFEQQANAAKPIVRRRRNRVTSDPVAETAMPMAASAPS